jgi:uncharacterized protein (DUF4415 family)
MRKDEPIVRAVLLEGKMYEKKPDGTLVPLKDRTNWVKLDAMSEEEIERIAADDPDGPSMTDEEWARAKIVHPPKVPVGLKLDADVLRWFKSKGRGYQTRINTVLRRYMEAQRKAG